MPNDMTEVLDRRFRDSKSRRIAEVLMTGKPYTRQQLADKATVSITTVNRVVEVLEEEGATILREKDGRETIFQLVYFGEARRRNALPELAEVGAIVRDELVGDEHMVDVTTSSGKRLRGILDVAQSAFQTAPVGTEVLVSGLLSDPSGETTLILETVAHGRRIQLVNAQNVTAH